jgi:FAD/FMN-containing dehydrogenase/Fe-S oxidoreductase
VLPVQFQDGDQIGTPSTAEVDVVALERDLCDVVKGEVRFDSGARAMYAHDASIYRQVPIGIVAPLDGDDVVRILQVARKHGAPIVPRGAGTSIPGQVGNIALCIDFSKHMNKVLELDSERQIARVQPGATKDAIDKAAAPHNLMFGPDPATHSRCTIGGMIGNDSGGPHSVLAGRTSQNLEAMDVLLYDGTRLTVSATPDHQLTRIIAAGGRAGEIYRRLRELRDRYADLIRERYPKVPRRVSGFALDALLDENGFHIARALAASEGTCALTLEATVRLVPKLPARALFVMGFDDIASAADHVPSVLAFKPMAVEGMERGLIDGMRKKGIPLEREDLLPKGNAWLLVEFGSQDYAESEASANRMADELGLTSKGVPCALISPQDQKYVWNVREAGLGATAFVPGESINHEGWEDTAVHPDQLGAYLREFKELMGRYEYRGTLYGHFGDGVVHVRLTFDLRSEEGIQKYKRFVQEGADLVHRHGGTLSGEHGDGQARGELLTREFGKELIPAFEQFKAIWDPDWKMNPGKIIAPDPIEDRLAEGPGFKEARPATHFAYPYDEGSFGHAVHRCVGAGVCRRVEGGTMCPSYMVTREEKHSTRGRARLLGEMLRGDLVKGGWQSEEVKSALDLCLACKGCRTDCPVRVDMATYKAEFLAHYYKGRLRPRHAYAFGLIHVWARLSSLMPRLVNFLLHAPGLSAFSKWMMGADQRRSIPRFAPQTFKSWFRGRKPVNAKGTRVVLWPDTFNNNFHPDTARAAVDVLEAAGFNVVVPMQDMCCGRPLYDYGMMAKAKKWLRHIIDVMQPEIEAGTPILVLEPSCATVFRDELLNLFPNDELAKKLSEQTFLLSEFLNQHAPGYEPPKLGKKAVVHGHCHHKAVMRMRDYEELLAKMGVAFSTLDSGCCGMAGAFGFEAGEHYEVAMKCGERVLLPAARETPPDTLLVADGFSCREQVLQSTGRMPLHLAEVLQMALSSQVAPEKTQSPGALTDAQS